MTSPKEDVARKCHEVRLSHAAGALKLEVEFTLGAGWTALFAPSGAGKTTILRMIAGLDEPDSGRMVRRDGTQGESEVLLDTSSGVCVAAHRRLVRMAAQRPALFPHRTVMGNVAYGWSVRGEKQGRDEFLERVLKLCRVQALRDKMPSQLSGGERQRVALARTLATLDCRLLLLDEPFTGLEAELRDELIADLRAWTAERGIPVLLVTHDLGEVFAAGAEVIRMEGGRVVACGPAEEVLAAERDRLMERLRGVGSGGVG